MCSLATIWVAFLVAGSPKGAQVPKRWLLGGHCGGNPKPKWLPRSTLGASWSHDSTKKSQKWSPKWLWKRTKYKVRTMKNHSVFVVFRGLGLPGASRDWAQAGENVSIGEAGVQKSGRSWTGPFSLAVGAMDRAGPQRAGPVSRLRTAQAQKLSNFQDI